MKTRQRLARLHTHPMFQAARSIIQTLKKQGYVAVFAGGCVRDSLLGLEPRDLDIATAAPPEEVERSFERTLPVGKEFGTIIVVEGGCSFEVTTFREEGRYLDGRRPSQVRFTGIEEDALRRDFTVNALFYDSEEEALLDIVGGLKDLRARVLRTVGAAQERFTEDRLRMLRAIRFVSQLGFTLDKEALTAIQHLGSELASVSAERILSEAKRFFMGSFLAQGVECLKLSGLYTHFWPEAERVNEKWIRGFPVFNNWENAFSALMLLARADDVETEQRLRSWKASRESVRRVAEQMHAVGVLFDPSSTRARRIRALGGETFADVLVLATGLVALNGRRAELDGWIADYLGVANTDGSLPVPFIGGQELIAEGVAPSARMGDIIRSMYEAQLEGEIRSKDEALKRISGFKA